MHATSHRRGMTLVELMVSTAILGIVMTAVVSSFLTTQRMLKDAMGLSELSLAAREIREKLLFAASPHSSNTHYAGLLSGKANSTTRSPVKSGNSAITMEVCTLGDSLAGVTSTPAQVEIELKTAESGSKRYLYNSKTPNAATRARWFWPIGMSVLSTSMSDMLSFDTKDAINVKDSSKSQEAVRLNIDLVLSSDVKKPDGSPLTRRERIVVPICGVIQPMKVSASGGDYY